MDDKPFVVVVGPPDVVARIQAAVAGVIGSEECHARFSRDEDQVLLSAAWVPDNLESARVIERAGRLLSNLSSSARKRRRQKRAA